MEFKPIPCLESLRPFIRNYWLITSYCTAHGTQQVFSNGAASLHFYLSQPVRLNEGKQFYRSVFYKQELKRVGVICEKGPFNIFGVEFVPFCSRMFFDIERTDKFFTPEDSNDIEFISLSNAIHASKGTEYRVKLLNDFFMKRLSDFPSDDINMERLNGVFSELVPTDASVPRVESAAREVSPADLASMACLSQKQFTRIFNKYVGMNPKAYLRLIRFHKALMKLQKSVPNSLLTDVALDCGYYDLAHMTTDFKNICGYSPSELIHEEFGLTETFLPNFSGLMKKKIKIENIV